MERANLSTQVNIGDDVASSRIITVRMDRELSEQFQTLRSQFLGLPPSTIVRMMVTATLALPLSEQIKIIESQVRHPGRRSKPRAIGLNARTRLTDE